MRHLHLSFILIALLSFTAHAQISVDNAGFESWSSERGFEFFPPYRSSNVATFVDGLPPNVWSVPGHNSASAVHVRVTHTADDTVEGILALGERCFTGRWTDGIVLTSVPDSFVFWARHEFSAIDSSFPGVFIIYKPVIGLTSFQRFALPDTVNSFQRYSALLLPANPLNIGDTLVLVISSGEMPGNWMEIDDLELTNGAPQFPNSDFETVDSLSWEELDDWDVPNETAASFGASPLVTASSDAYTGSSALQIETGNIDFNCQANMQVPLVASDWQAWNPSSNPSVLGGMYKYSPVGNDTALAALLFTKYDATTGENDTLFSLLRAFFFTDNSSYTPYAISLDTTSWAEQPDSFQVLYASSDIFSFTRATPAVGSVLLLDAALPGTAIAAAIESLTFDFYPNPAQDKIELNFDVQDKDAVLEVLDLQGKTLMTQPIELSQSSLELDISSLAQGVYLLRLTSQKGSTTKKLLVF